jgi:hypothetical protein
MSEPIKVGDLVGVVQGGCTDTYIGYIFTVLDLSPVAHRCARCNVIHGTGLWARHEPWEDNGVWIATSRLKRIPPLSELEGVKTEEDIREQV